MIIGGGPIGLACGIEAKRAGLNYVIIEKGCLVNSLYHYPVNMTFFSTSERLEIGNIPFVSILPKPNRAEALEYYRRAAIAEKLRIQLFEEVQHVEGRKGNFSVQTSRQTYQAAQVILATGFYDLPVMLQIPGETLPQVKHYYNDPHFYAFRKVLVIGANNSAVDAALEIWRKGAEVTMVVRGEEIGRRVKYWVKPDIENRIREGSIHAWFNACVTEIAPGTVTIRDKDGHLHTLDNDFVLAMTGYKPNLSLLEQLGVRLSDEANRQPVYNPDTMESNREGLYLAGVICGGLDTHSWFIENSREHATKIIRHLCSPR